MKILKDSAIYVIGELFSKIVPFLLLPYLSRKLGVEGFGELSYYQTYLALFGMFLVLGQDGAVARYFYFYGKRSLNLVVTAGYAYTLLLGSVMLLICWWFQSEIMAYLVIASIFQSFLSVQLSVRQCQKQAISYTTIQVLSGIVSALLTVVMLEWFNTDLVEKRILAILLSNIIVFFIAYLLYVKKVEKFKWFSLREYQLGIMYILGFGIPLLLHHGSLFLRGQLDRIFIHHQFSDAELGLYAMGATVASIVSVGIMAVNKAVLPYYYEALKQKKLTVQKIHRWALFSLILVPIPAIVMWFIPETFVIWLFGEQFLGTKYYIILFLIATTLSVPYLILVNYLFYHGKNQWISFCSILTTIVYVGALMMLMFKSIEWVPYASIISAIVILPILWMMTKRVKNI